MSGPVLGFLSYQDHTGSTRTNQDQSFMILAFFNPQNFSKTPPTCVRSGPGALEQPGPHRITQDQPGPVLHDPCLSCSSDFFKNASYLCPVQSWDSIDTRITKDHPGPTRTSPCPSPCHSMLIPSSFQMTRTVNDHLGQPRTGPC